MKNWALRAFNKFNNDWTMNLVAMVAYNVLTSFVPLVLALLTLLALVPAAFGSPMAVVDQINQLLPGQVRTDLHLDSLIKVVNNRSGIFTLVSIVTLLWGGSNLFGALESAFAVIYRVKTREFVPQKLVSVVMIVVFTVLLPLSFVSTLLVGATTTTLGKVLPQGLHSSFAAIIGPVSGFAALFLLFSAIYIVVPNRQVAWRHAWRGAGIAALALTIVNTVFPFYTAHFVGTQQYGAAAIGTALIIVTWFWLFSVIVLVGAQVNTLAMGIDPWPHDLTRLLMAYSISSGPGGVGSQVEGLPFSGIARDSQEQQQPSRT